jgi:hypothetical protein
MIYEFSTGIDTQYDPNNKNNWWSVGDRGGWMHNTYRSQSAYDIPYPIQQAYINQEFAVGETNNAKFTVMGRYISLGTEQWSVVAFLTYAKDEKGRQVPTYRFFFSEGNAILDILCRIITFEAEKQTLPVFNPFAITNLYQYRPTALPEINNKIPKDNSLEEEVKKEANIRTHILKENACTLVGGRFVGLSLFHLNRLALQRASAINEAGNISWAYNADVLQRPETFILVQATNERSYQYLMSKRNSRKKYQAGVDEKAIETALQSLVESDNIDDIAPVSLNVIAEALQDSKVDEAYVRGIAEILGLNDYELNNQTYDQLIKLHIILSLFFPNVKEQTQRWQLLGNKGWNEVITAYISKIKKYVKKAGLPSLLQDTNRELIEYCFQNISFETRNVEPNKSEHIAWVLTKSLWANDNTLLDLENTIRDYVGYAFEKSKQEIVTSNSPTQDYFQLVKYFRFLRNIGRVELEKFEFVWQFWNFVAIQERGDKVKKARTTLIGSLQKPSAYYDQLVDVLRLLSQEDGRLSKIYNFFNTINQSHDGVLVRILRLNDDVFDKLQADQDLINQINLSTWLFRLNVSVSVVSCIVSAYLLFAVIGTIIGILAWVWDQIKITGHEIILFVNRIWEWLTNGGLIAVCIVLLPIVIFLIWRIFHPPVPPKPPVPTNVVSTGSSHSQIFDITSLLKKLNSELQNKDLRVNEIEKIEKIVQDICILYFDDSDTEVNLTSLKTTSDFFKNISNQIDTLRVYRFLFLPKQFLNYIVFLGELKKKKDNSRYDECKNKALTHQNIFQKAIAKHSNAIKGNAYRAWLKSELIKSIIVSLKSKKIGLSDNSFVDVLIDITGDKDRSILCLDDIANYLDELLQNLDNIEIRDPEIAKLFNLLKQNQEQEQKPTEEETTGRTTQTFGESSEHGFLASVTPSPKRISEFLSFAKFFHLIFDKHKQNANLMSDQTKKKVVALAAYFYEVSQGGAPPNIYAEIPEDKVVYGKTINERKTTPISKLRELIYERFIRLFDPLLQVEWNFFKKIPRQTVNMLIGLAVVALLAGLGLAFNLHSPNPNPPIARNPNATSTPIITTSVSPSVEPTPTPVFTSQPVPSPTILKYTDIVYDQGQPVGNKLTSAIESVNLTYASFDKIIQECKKKKLKDDIIKTRIRDTLTDRKNYAGLDFAGTLKRTLDYEQKQILVQILAEFQQRNQLEFDGIMTVNGSTIAKFKDMICP